MIDYWLVALDYCTIIDIINNLAAHNDMDSMQ